MYIYVQLHIKYIIYIIEVVIIDIVFYLYTAIEHFMFLICAILNSRSLLLIKVKGIKLTKEPFYPNRYKALKFTVIYRRYDSESTLYSQLFLTVNFKLSLFFSMEKNVIIFSSSN